MCKTLGIASLCAAMLLEPARAAMTMDFRTCKSRGSIMSVRKRKWITRAGERREAWVVDYTDQDGERHIKTFERKKDADAHEAAVRVDVSKGVHTPESRSVTVADAAENWLSYIELKRRERST